MSKEEVLSILGPPDGRGAQSNGEYLSYYLDYDSYTRHLPYVVTLVNGKVDSFGSFVNLFDMANRPAASALPGIPGGLPSTYVPASASWGGPAAVGTYGRVSNGDFVAELMRLKALKDQGVLADDEFQKAKAKILAQP